MLLDPPRTRVDELRLVADSTKASGACRFWFVDVFVVNGSGNAVIPELKDIRSAGLLSGKQGRWIGTPSYDAMKHMERG